jgi:hypothetical protein
VVHLVVIQFFLLSHRLVAVVVAAEDRGVMASAVALVVVLEAVQDLQQEVETLQAFRLVREIMVVLHFPPHLLRLVVVVLGPLVTLALLAT